MSGLFLSLLFGSKESKVCKVKETRRTRAVPQVRSRMRKNRFRFPNNDTPFFCGINFNPKFEREKKKDNCKLASSVRQNRTDIIFQKAHRCCADEAPACMNTLIMLTHCETNVAFSTSEPYGEPYVQEAHPADLYYIGLYYEDGMKTLPIVSGALQS